MFHPFGCKCHTHKKHLKFFDKIKRKCLQMFMKHKKSQIFDYFKIENFESLLGFMYGN